MEHLGRRAVLQQFTGIHHRRVAAQQQGFARLSGGVHHGGFTGGKQRAQLVAQLFAQLVIQVDQRLVQQHQRSRLGQGAGQGHALLLAARQLGRIAVQEHLDVQLLGQCADFLVHVFFTAQLERRGDVVAYLERRVVDELLVDHGHIALAHRLAGHVHTVHFDPAVGGHVQAGHDAHQAGLARLGGPQQYGDRAGLGRNAHLVQPRLRPHLFADAF